MSKSSFLNKAKVIPIETWFMDYYVVLCQAANRLVNDKAISEDIVQDVFFKLWKKRSNQIIPENTEAYLKRLVFNESIDWLRKNKQTKNSTLDLDALQNIIQEDFNSEDKSEEIRNTLHQILDNLPDKCRTVFILSRFEKLTYKEIAEYLNISEKTVENHIYKAVNHIREHYPKHLLPIVLFYKDWLN